MLTLFIITVLFSAIYFLYPFWLKLQPEKIYSEERKEQPEGLSIVYLSQNCASLLSQKIPFLLKEMDDFSQSELVVIDDGSEDNSREILEQFKDNRLRVFSKKTKQGIAHSMNLGVEMSKFGRIVFCDQRQFLSQGIIKKLIAPLQYAEIGAVSSCISNYDKTKRFSFLRAHENFIKKEEGKTGNLMGVYGPLYALKKKCFTRIPEYIILDDLYLSLSILRSNNIVFLRDCQIYDESLEKLYTYQRARRYVKGFIQLLREKKLLAGLSTKQIIMMVWHKYLRLVLPVLYLVCYAILAAHAFSNPSTLLFFSAASLLIVLLLFSPRIKIRSQFDSVIRLIAYYSLALVETTVFTLLKKND